MDYSMSHRRGCGICLRYMMIVSNIFYALVAAAVIAVFVYFLVTQVEFVRYVLGTELVVVATCLVIAAGCLLEIIALIGIIGACVRKSPGVIAAYFILMIVAFLTMMAGIVCALVFKTWLTDHVRYQMQNTLIQYYGVNLDNKYNAAVTANWDTAQTQWKCCAVDDQSWDTYQQSAWFKIQPGVPGAAVNAKVYVPKSCCALDPTGHITDANLRTCQTNINGPPARRQGGQYAGEINTALNYRGCYQSAQDYLIHDTVSWFVILISVGSVVAFLMLVGVVMSVSLYVSIKRELKLRKETVFVEYDKQSGSVIF